MSATRWSPPRRVVALDGALPDAAATRRHVTEALGDEPGAVLVRPAARTRALLAGLPGVPVVAVLPDLAQLLRDVGERGAPRAAASRLAAGGIAGLWRLSRTVLRPVLDVARQDFRGLVPVLLEPERAVRGCAPLKPWCWRRRSPTCCSRRTPSASRTWCRVSGDPACVPA